jgi:uncharacterized protein YdeI (YjbR/CyaY-like superfamily)
VIAKSFKATLERNRSRLNWVIARIPLDVSKIWGTRGQLKVKGEINGFAFRTSLFPTGTGEHVLLVNKRMQAGAKVGVGATAQFRLEPDTAERTIVVPEELSRIFAEYRALQRWFDKLNYSTRKWITDRIVQVKGAAARVRRAEQTAECLLAAVEAERELPPVLRIAFDRDPQGYAAWKRMSPLQRRSHLIGIFSYRSPAAQARRIARALESAKKLSQ